MFSGIVEEMGILRKVGQSALTIEAQSIIEDLGVSDSICVNGACLTVTSVSGCAFTIDVVPETLRRTNLGNLSEGDMVNLERSIKVGGRLGGHFVQGHVDCTGLITEILPDGDAQHIKFSAPTDFMRYVVEKGFVCVDGVSLTVVSVEDSCFSIALIPFTRTHTVFGKKHVGDHVNLEADVIAKYVEKLYVEKS